jgi:ABC transport system ATP-binding/permease protein
VRIEDAVSASAGPALIVRAKNCDRTLQAGPSYRIGRDPASDVVINEPRVSWHHATLRRDDGVWLMEDPGSTNGTWAGRQRVSRIQITGDCQLRLGHPDDGAVVAFSLRPMPAEAPPQPQPQPQPQPRLQPPQPQPPQAPPPQPYPPGGPQPQFQPQPQPQFQPQPQAHAQPQAQPEPQAQAQRLHPPVAPEWPADSRSGALRPPSAVMQLPARRLRIGRAADNDVVVADLGVSRYHAELRRSPAGFEIVDLNSHNGTFVNGIRVTAAPLTERDTVGVGPATFRLVGDRLEQFVDTGEISLSARDLTVRLPSGKVLLDHVSFPLGERCLLGVIGPSGAGKSTLLGALTGMRPATDGSVLYDNRDLYTHYAELRHRIGLVPQENILHTQLTARRALGYAAELRFPRDTSKAERQRRIDEVLAELSLTQHKDTKTDRLSGGQQKRVNVALELLTKPSLLFLDEPTSGLDPGLDKSVMEMMAGLAHDGRTVIVVTHSVANLNLCDRLLVLVPGGQVAYFGPPAEGLRHFGKPGWAEVFQAFDNEPDRDWAGDFRRSEYYARYVAADMHNPAPAVRPAQAVPAPPATRNRVAQLSTLARRYLAVIASDRVYLAVLGVMPIVLGVLIRAVPAPLGLAGHNNGGAESLLLILVIAACFTGAANAVRELVKERAIYSRERAAGLSAGAYLVSKLIILGLISSLQAGVLVLIGLAGVKLPHRGTVLVHLPLVELLLAIGLLAITSMTLGLLISAMVNTSEKTMPLLVVSVMFQVILTGGVFALAGKAGLEQVAWLSPSRWGFAATASTVNLNVIQPGGTVTVPAGKAAAASKTAASKTADGKAGAGKAGAAGAHGRPAGRSGPGRAVPHAGRSAQAATSPAAAPAAAGSASSAVQPDPLWKHTAKTWLTDMAMMVVLGLAFTLISWWRLIRLSPGRRK